MNSLRGLVRRSVAVAIASGIIAAAIVSVLTLVSPRGLSGLVHAAPPFTDRSAPPSLAVGPPAKGFDGQFYYRLAVAPFSTARRVGGVRFDIAAYRSQRAGYPMLAWLASLGRGADVPKTLVVVNVVAMFALGWIGAAIARAFERGVWWGVLFPLFPGFVYSLGFDLTEIVAAALVAGAVLALWQERRVLAVLLMSAAVLTRETTAVLPIALVITAVWERTKGDRDAHRRALAGVAPLAVLVAWQLFLRSRWHALPLTSSGDNNVTLPFRGLFDARRGFLPPSSSDVLFRDISLAFLVVVIVIACLHLRESPAPRFVKVAFGMGVLVVVLLNTAPWAGATSFMRAATESYVFGLIVVVGAPARRRVRGLDLVAGSTIALFVLTFVSEIGKART